MESFVQDIRYGIRSLRKAPAFTAVAALALALGMGANTVLFSVISYSLLRPLPYPEPERLLLMSEHMPTFPNASVAWLNFVDWKAQLPENLFSHLAASRRDSFNLVEGEQPERLSVRLVTSEFLPEFGAQPALGRFYTADEDKPGAPRTVVLTYAFWQQRFGGDPKILGRSLDMSGESYTVIGVTPKGFKILAGNDVFVPLGLFADRFQDRGSHPGIYVFGRMKPGVTIDQVKKAFDAISLRLGDQYRENKNNTVNVVSLREDQVSGARPALLVLWGAVLFVLLIAAANVSNLLLARATARQGEIAIRIALGAGRWRIVRQLLTESALLALLGAALGIALAAWGLDALSPLLTSLPRGSEIRLDRSALVFTGLVSLFTGLGFGLYPALKSSSPHVHELLKNVRSTATHARLRSALVVAEIALSMVLLIGAGLLMRSFSHLTGTSPGFDTSHLLNLSISLPPARYPTGAELARFESEVRRGAAELPGVVSVAVSDGFPLLGTSETSFRFEGQPEPEPGHATEADIYAVSPGYVETMKIPILEGRSFQETDTGRPVALIDETMARRYFPGQSAIGKRFAGRKAEHGHGQDMPPIEVIGVTAHVQNYSLDGRGPVDLGFYVQYATTAQKVPQYLRNIYLTVRANGDPKLLAEPLRKLVGRIDPQQPVYAVQTGDEIIANAVADRRLNLLLLGIFAAVALLLATVGIYGVMSYSVEQRTREIGIRMALGAERVSVLRLIVGHGARLAGIGIAIGIAGSLGLSRVISSLLFGVSATDPIVYAGLGALLGTVAVAACWMPARRAIQVDPAIALRAE